MQANDSIANDTDFTLYGMNSSNWKNCIDGNCLWFDGSDDYAKVNVDDWLVISQSVNGFGLIQRTNQTMPLPSQ